jgi:hypothetical protein
VGQVQRAAVDREARQEEVRKLLPEIGSIGNPRYRSAVLEIWTEMWVRSPHTDISGAPFSHKCPGVALVEHVRAVTLAAQGLAHVITTIHGVQVDHDLLLTACLLHDVSKLVEIGPDGQLTREGRLFPHAYLAGKAAGDAGLPNEVVSLIVTHTPVVNIRSPQYVEALILEHADLASAHVLIESKTHGGA